MRICVWELVFGLGGGGIVGLVFRIHTEGFAGVDSALLLEQLLEVRVCDLEVQQRNTRVHGDLQKIGPGQ